MTECRITHSLRTGCTLLALSWAASASGAVPPRINSPLSHTAVPGPGNPSIQFQGTYPALTSITVQALNPSGGWSNLGSTIVTSKAGGWAVTVQVSAAFYFQPCGVGVFRVMPGDGKPQLTVMDEPCLDAAPPDTSVCLKDFVVLSQAGRYPTTLAGSLSVEGSKQAEKFACYHDVLGTLTISDSSPSSLVTWLNRGQAEAEAQMVLPNLAHVSNDLKVLLDRFKVLPVVDTLTTGGWAISALDLPLLTQVGGSINLRAVDLAPGGPISGHSYVFGTGALTTIGANVTIDNQAAFNHYVALSALTNIPGNLTVNWTKDSDLIESSLLQNLTAVHGNVAVTAKANIQFLLPALANVDGNVRIQSPGSSVQPYSIIANLNHVGGNLSVLGGFKLNCNQPTFPNLASVNGQLILNGGAPRGTLGAAGLNLGGLQIVNTQVTILPLPAGLQMATNGAVSIQQNSNLCQCQVNSFISLLQSAGWAGTPPPPNNGAAALCTPCPAPACQ